MKLRTIIHRLSQKTNSPKLFFVLSGKADIESLGDDCMIWTGAATASGLIRTMDRDVNNIPVYYMTNRKPFGTIRVNKKTEYVHRFVYQLLFKPEYEFRMTNKCGNTLCCHPRHWEVTMNTPDLDMANGYWTEEEALEAVEAMLSRYDVYSWADVEANPLMQDIPQDLIRKCLVSLNKEHLV